MLYFCGMEWTATVDGYCERLSPAFWAEPVNAVTNAAFVIAAVILWMRIGSRPLPIARLLTAILAAIGIGSFLFHTFATVWAGLADVAPIGAFIVVYLYAAFRSFWGCSIFWAIFAVIVSLLVIFLLAAFFDRIAFFTISAAYWPIPLLILGVAVSINGFAARTAQGLTLGAVILVISLTLRSVDQTWCTGFPLGTHFLWHLLNAVMLGWMIEVYRRHVLAPPPAGR